jgi:uncharacterized membrane protein YhiD involved in acid resistance
MRSLLLAADPQLTWLQAFVRIGAAAGFWKGAVIATLVALVSLRPLESAKVLALPQRAATHLVVELKQDGTAGDVLDAIERSGDLLALRRDGKRLEVEVRMDRADRARTLDSVAALPQVEEARWHK